MDGEFGVALVRWPTDRRLVQLVAGAVVTGLVLASSAPATIDNWIATGRFEINAHAPTGAVVVVEIDARSLGAIGQWPWPREIHAALIDRLRAAGASEIALDIDFSTTSTDAGDAALTAALIRAGGGVILPVFRQQSTTGGQRDHINVPIPAFADHSWPATVNVRVEEDGRVRSYPFGDVLFGLPTLAMPVLLGGRVTPTEGEFLVDFGVEIAGIDRISAVDLLRGDIESGRIEGRKVIVGSTATELRDFFTVPRYGVLPGVLLQALATETLLQTRLLWEPSSTVGMMTLAIFCLLFVIATRRREIVQKWLVAIAFILLIEACALVLQAHWSIVLRTGAWDLALIGLAVVATARELDIRRLAASIFRTEAAENRAVLERVIENSSAGVIIVSGIQVVVANASAGVILGLDPDTLVSGSTCDDALPPELARFFERASSLEPGEGRHDEVRLAKAGAELVLDVSIAASEPTGGRQASSPSSAVLCATFVDVTGRRRAEERNAYLASFDDLTGLANGAQFRERLGACIGGVATGGAVLMFDLDRFKLVNDSLGHRCGDLVLKAAAARAVDVVGDRGLVARLGGDEFAILVANVDRGLLGALATDVINSLAEPFLVDGYRIAVGASVGIAVASTAGPEPAEVVRAADLALNAAKEDGGGSFRFFQHAMASRLNERRLIEIALWDAMERDEISVAYQPQVDLETGTLTGVEALARWHHPTRGWVPPSEFIPVAEATGMIERIGAFVLRRAISEIARLSSSLKLAVNVSPIQFVRGDIVKAVKEAMSDSGLAPSRLELEITESTFLGSGALARQKVNELTSLGFRIALDDFGTGYSSLSYLSQLPINKIKIDRAFVAGLPEASGDAGIVRAVAAMGLALGIKVNAEGIETPEQAECLRALGCAEGQGFLYGAAATPHQLRRILAGRTMVLPRETRPVEIAFVSSEHRVGRVSSG